MINLSKSELEKLFNWRDKFCISIYMPAEKAGPDTRKNHIWFKNLVGEAESKLVEQGLSTVEAENLLENPKKLIDDNRFWQHQQEGLAYFISEEESLYYRLPHSFEPLMVLSDRFHLKPLLPLIIEDSHFYLLALAQNQIRFYEGNHYQIQELPLPEGVPASLAEALKYNDPEKQFQFHSVKSNQTSIYHGQGVGTTDNKENIVEYFQKVDRGLQSFLNGQKSPLILAGVEYLLPIYQETNSYPHLLAEGITGNPENSSHQELHQQAWQLVKPQLDANKQEAIAQYPEFLNNQQATSNIEEIVAAAYYGQIDTLFVAPDVQIWGIFKSQTGSVQIDPNSTSSNFDLLNFAALHTFLQGGIVYSTEPENIPNGQPMAAILRYQKSALPVAGREQD